MGCGLAAMVWPTKLCYSWLEARNMLMDTFWTKGAKNYGKALREQYNSQRDSLQSRLQQCKDPVERQALNDELEALKKDFQNRLRNIGRSLF